ncbi:hypothetical protein [Archangium primigenium]|uniref:hypothetical protein n=1 Tax=[Archangium] primigenium TaxID=2792470 RepID=UPI001957915F|nr:hypothetical protein [Archangium primigenium]MBM7115733.1 hypothetical protein [Archangium primigenium]
MRDPVQAMINAIERDEGGVAIVWCPDLGLREWLVGEVESLAAAGANPVRKDDVEGALTEPSRLVLLVPANEREVVLDLDASRDRLLEAPRRTQPIVLFLVREGDGQRALAAEAMSLASWVGGSDADPDALAQIDVKEEREAFERDLGTSPEEWLKAWRVGAHPNTAENFRMAYRAMLLEAT